MSAVDPLAGARATVAAHQSNGGKPALCRECGDFHPCWPLAAAREELIMAGERPYSPGGEHPPTDV